MAAFARKFYSSSDMVKLRESTSSLFHSVRKLFDNDGDRRDVRPGAPSEPNEYNFNFKKRGIFVIINNKNFDPGTGLPYREGSDVDAERLEERFQDLGFVVRRYDDVTCAKMNSLMVEAASFDHSDHDCFGCAILSHGGQGLVHAKDGHVTLDQILQPFRGNKCQSLVGKPKLFFIQGCQEQDVQPPHHHHHHHHHQHHKSHSPTTNSTSGSSNNSTTGGTNHPHPHPRRSPGVSPSVSPCHSRKSSPTHPTHPTPIPSPGTPTLAPPKNRTVPVEADCLFSISTVPGCYSWRNNQDGSWFIQALCIVLENYGTKMELMHMLTHVNRIVAYEFASCSDKEFSDPIKQMPTIVSMLTRYVFFRPKKQDIR